VSDEISVSPEELRVVVQALVGKDCWSITSSRGGAISVDFGRRIPLERPLKKPHLSSEKQRFRGELGLLIRCAWRVDDEGGVLGIWSSLEDVDRVVPVGLDPLLQRRVSAVELVGPAHDLVIALDEIRRRIFCDRAEGDGYNYFVETESDGFTVWPGGRVARGS